MADAPALEGYQEGSRWINKPPTGEDVSKWFVDNVELDEGMKPDEWVRGIVIIPAKEKYKEARLDDRTGKLVVDEGLERMVYVPYSKVEARVAYFWKLMDVKGWRGDIPLVPTPGLSEGGELFFLYTTQGKDGKPVKFIGCSAQVAIYDASDVKYGHEGKLLRQATIGTKVVPTRDRWGNPDVNAPMKAQTGAVGRALGFAGILVIPGSGIATAEDMQEALGTDAASQAALPEVQGEPESSSQEPEHERAIRLMAQLEEEKPGAFDEFKEWASGRKIKLDQIGPDHPALRAIVKKCEDLLKDE